MSGSQFREFFSKKKKTFLLVSTPDKTDGGCGLFLYSLRRGGKGVLPADLPAEVSTQVGHSQFTSDIFKQTLPNITSATDGANGLGSALSFIHF